MMFARWNLMVNDFLGIPRSGWGEGFPTTEILLVALGLSWVLWVTMTLLAKTHEQRPT